MSPEWHRHLVAWKPVLPVFVACLMACLLCGLFLKEDPSSVVDHFYAQRSERLILKTWMRQAIAVTYDECRKSPQRCVGKVVVWTEGDSREPINWLNSQQVPPVVGKEGRPFTAVGIVKRVLPDAIEMIFLGSPDAAYGGTTLGASFGLLQRNGALTLSPGQPYIFPEAPDKKGR
jgi:hypothetical protein